MELKNKVIIVTGASDGIGKQIALSLAAKNTKLALIARNQEKLDQVAELAKSLGAVEVSVYSCDISDTPKLIKTINDIAEDFDGIDGIINNAGIWQKMMPLDDIQEAQIDTLISTNLTALIHATKTALPHLRKRPEAAIMNVSSKSGVTAQMGQSVYTATKHAVRGFTDVLKEDLKDSNVRVAGVYQAGTNTGMFADTGESMPVEKFTDPADLADVIVFMLSRPAKIWIHDIRVQF